MISLEESIPSKSLSYKIGEEIFYYQFNDVSFFIEDEEQENFFFCILKRLFPDICLEKIFPLGGKDNVIKEATINQGDKKKVFIVDKDFDDLLNKIISIDNLFYLDRYSIENFLIEKDAIIAYIISAKPRLKKNDINNQLCIEDCLSNIFKVLKDVVYLHLVVQIKCPHMQNISLNHERFIKFQNKSFSIQQKQLENYKQNIMNELTNIDKRLTILGQIKKAKMIASLKTREQCIIHIPGKYTIKMLKQMIESLFGLTSRNTDSFCYNIAEKSDFTSLNNLKEQITEYIN